MGAAEPQAGEPPQRERLDVPSASSLERRLLVGDAAPRRRHKPAIQAVPNSRLLGRLQAFLPTMEAANAQLEQQLAAGDQVAMEHGSDEEGGVEGEGGEGQGGPVVHLDLACGLFDLKDPSAVAAAEAALVNGGVAVEAYGGSGTNSSDSSESGGESDSEANGTHAAAARQSAAAAAGPAAAAGQPGSSEAMDEDGREEGGQGEAGLAQPAAAAAGRRRKLRGRRHAGIEELS